VAQGVCPNYYKKKKKERKSGSRALLAYIYNPSYSGSKYQEVSSLKLIQENSSGDSISKKANTK
jgi:hypothetical protein